MALLPSTLGRVVEKVLDQMLTFVIVFATVGFCQPRPKENDYYYNEVSDGFAIKKCAEFIRVYHGKILVNTRSQKYHQTYRGFGNIATGNSERERHTFDSFRLLVRGESSALESEVLLGYRARERVFAGKYQYIGNTKEIFPIYQRVEPLPALLLQPTIEPPHIYQFR